MSNSRLVVKGGKKWHLSLFVLLCLAIPGSSVFGARIADVRGTKHNLSAVADGSGLPSGGTVPSRTVKATGESQVCVFCHTPHAASAQVMPLWNRKFSDATYAPYTSSSLDAEIIRGAVMGQPGGSSKLCLSCHDGTLAIGGVNVLNGAGGAVPGGVAIEMTGTAASGVMASGSGTTSGYTRNLGISLTNDHPISVDYTSELADRDGELRAVDASQKYPAVTGEIVGVRSMGYWPRAALEPTGAGGIGQIQCGTCHDPHLRETDAALGNQKFLRLNRFQNADPVPTYSSTNDINCVACHNKDNGLTGTWSYSSHANPLVATQTYSATAAARNEFPDNLPVWKASCLNCHDTHSVQGSRRLLREGTDSASVPKAGGNAALEETCYQCHTAAGSSAITGVSSAKDIQSDFALTRHMTIASTSEVHDIGGSFNDSGLVDCTVASNNKCGADFIEQRSKLGVANLGNRHTECTDCHNPHRVVKFNSLVGAGAGLGGTPDSTGTHKHTDAAGYTHTNIASGALRGTFGVEPEYSSADFNAALSAISYIVKRGDPGASTSTLKADSYVTREYQICLKCHSDYGYSDNNQVEYSSNRPPLPTGASSLTPAGTNGLNFYTNQAKELQAPSTHQGEPMMTDSGAAPAYADGISQTNYRSWHPVLDSTGRTAAVRGGITATSVFTLPWSNAVGTQTMYCSDCHGAKVTSATSVIPDNPDATRQTWGPHGSENDFVLKGAWNSSTGSGQSSTGLCFKCHDYGSYATNSGTRTGFFLGGETLGSPAYNTDGHSYHASKIGYMRCDWCHTAVPHGWKNKGLLVNLNDVGPEAGLATGTQVRNSTTTAYSAAPYYLNAVLKVVTFAASGQWKAADCGSAGAPGNGQTGLNWMAASGVPDTSENCATPP